MDWTGFVKHGFVKYGLAWICKAWICKTSLRSKRSRTTRTKLGPREGVFSHSGCTKNEARAKSGRRGVGEEKGGNPLDFEKRLLGFTVEFIY